MQHLRRSARPVAALALAVGLGLVPGAAFAGTTEPTVTTTTTPATPDPTTTTDPVTVEPTTPDPTTATTDPTPDPATTTATGSTTSPAPDPTTSSPTAAPEAQVEPKAAADAEPGKRVPFGAARQLRAALVAGDAGEQAAYAGGFMVRTLAANGDHYNYPGGSFFDGGNTIDAILGLDGAGVGGSQADETLAYLGTPANLDNYIGPAFGPDELWAGPIAKAIVGVVAHGADATDFGGRDLVADLEGLLAPSGRFSDASGFGDNSNTIGQSLAVIALGRATGSVPSEAVDFLLAQQCPDGGFRGSPDASDCTSDLDATAFAAQALLGAGEDAAATAALDFLASRQAANGGFLNQDGQYNANTAGVAAQAFAAGGYTDELASAQAFLATLQMDCSFAAGLRGGVAFTAEDFAVLKSSPGNTEAVDRALRATPQATLALAGGSLLDVTADGAEDGAPTLSCPAPSTTSPRPTTAAAAVPSDPPVTSAGSASPGALAFTGANAAATVLLGVALLVAGALALVVSRRKGAHA